MTTVAPHSVHTRTNVMVPIARPPGDPRQNFQQDNCRSCSAGLRTYSPPQLPPHTAWRKETKLHGEVPTGCFGNKQVCWIVILTFFHSFSFSLQLIVKCSTYSEASQVLVCFFFILRRSEGPRPHCQLCYGGWLIGKASEGTCSSLLDEILTSCCYYYY
jgi:hypothetical protein